MSILEKIDQDTKKAMIAKDQARVDTLRFLKSAIKYVAIDKTAALTDADVMQVIQKQIKQRKESIQQFVNAGRAELAAKEEKEVAVIESYLPSQLSEADLLKIVENEIKASGASTKKDFGRMMKVCTEKLAGQADNKRISEILGKILV